MYSLVSEIRGNYPAILLLFASKCVSEQSSTTSSILQITDLTSRNGGQPLGPEKQTNQRAELTAVKIALEIAPLQQDVLICSDSMYTIESVTSWY